jgi:PAS domain S-box-containing protein
MRTDESLRQVEEQFDRQVEGVREYAIFLLDPTGHVLSWNAGAEQFKGYQAEEIIGRHFSCFYPEEAVLAGAPERALSLAEVEGRYENEGWRVRKDGSLFWANVVITALRDDSGTLRGFLKITRDMTERRATEEVLRRAGLTLNAVFEASPAAIIAIDLDINCTLWNPAAERIFGWTASEVLGRPLPNVPTHKLPEFHANLASTRRGEFLTGLETERLRKDGSLVHVSVATAALRDDAGAITGLMAVITNITDRKRAEEALLQSERRFARFMQQLPGLAWIKDLKGRYVYVNDAAEAAFQTSRAELYGRTDLEVFPRETAERFRENDCRALESGTGVQVTETLEHANGIVHVSLVSKFPISGPSGEPELVGGMAIDITELKQAEQVLEESERRFRQLAESINEVFWMSNPETTEILYISPAYERVWGRTCASLREHPRSFLDAVLADDRERVRAAALDQHARGEPTDLEYRISRPDGTIRWIRDRGFPVKDAAGRVYRFVGIAEDTTEKKQAEEALKEANRRKDEFLATLAHELRNPLAPIRTGLELMKLAGDDRQVIDDARGLIERQLAQMVRLIDDLLDVSRITRGRLELRTQRIPLAAAVQVALEATGGFIESCGHELSVELPPEPIELDADLTRLAQVFSNLLNNAAKYTEQGGRIWLSAEAHDGEVVVRVRDTGIGIPAELLPDVFEMFTQVDQSLERSRGGLGIGLTLARRLVEMHKGTIEARSGGAGLGSEFIVRLPAARGSPASEPSPCGAGTRPAGRANRKILVVDDNRDAALTLSKLLRRMGNDVQTVHDGEEAVDAASAFRPELVLLDIGLPKLNGYDAARQIRDQSWGKDMILVALTGWGQDDDRRRSREAGFDHHLVKPVDPDALVRLLNQVQTTPA